MIRELAEAPTRFEKLAPDEELVECADCLVYFAPGIDARACSVQRVRPDSSTFESTVEHVRSLLRERGRRAATWEILIPAHPRSTLDRLRAMGMHPSTPELAVIMRLDAPPPAANPDVVVNSVDSIDELKAHVSVTHEVFGMLERLPDELARIEVDGPRKLADRTFIRYNARLSGELAGAGTATFTGAGVMLHTGSTLSRLRKRGVYGALVAHRWAEAVLRGTPHLVTRAGPMSRPILSKLGFIELGEVHFFIDSLEK